MVYDEGIQTMLERAKFRDMTREEYDTAVKARRRPPLIARNYPDRAVCLNRRVFLKPFNGPQKWLRCYPDIRDRPDVNDLFERFRVLMVQRYGADPTQTQSMAGFGLLILRPFLKDVPELRGFVAEFIRKCQKPALLGPAYGKPCHVNGELTLLDRCASYPAVYATFPGIPTGVPRVIQSWNDVKRSFYYYVQVDVKWFRPRSADPFPLLTANGVQYWDKTWLEMVEKFYEVEYEFLSGYYFMGIENNIRELTLDLWNLRRELGCDPLALWVKRLMNTWWGKAIYKWRPVKELFVAVEDLKKWKNHPSIYSYRSDGRVRLVRPILAPWQRPQFGVNVLSFSRKIMQEALCKAEVVYSNTDSLLVFTKDIEKLGVNLGKDLGDFKEELRATEFVCLSPKKYLYVLEDGSLKSSYGKPSLEWFTAKLAELRGI
jgi:hypothetical protein